MGEKLCPFAPPVSAPPKLRIRPSSAAHPDEVVALGLDRMMVERVDRMVATSEFKRQVPPIAKLGPRTAGVDYLYPRRRPGSAAP